MKRLTFLLCFACSSGVQAQDSSVERRMFSQAEVAAIAMPELAFKLSTDDENNYEKYYYFHRPDTDFDSAYADIMECDALASGLGVYKGRSEPYPGYYGQNGIGGAIGSVLADAIFGSAAKRKTRRINMRNCMGFKGYARYGLSKDVWKTFNFEEGSGREDEDVRTAALLKQARVASGANPAGKVLEP